MAVKKQELDKDLLKEKILQGLTIKELAEFFNRSQSYISRAKKQYGLAGLSTNTGWG